MMSAVKTSAVIRLYAAQGLITALFLIADVMDFPEIHEQFGSHYVCIKKINDTFNSFGCTNCASEAVICVI